MAVNITKLKEQLMNSIDTTDLVEVEKVERYIDLVKAFRKINKTINKEGESVTIKNGSQIFVKAHPLISERNKINSSLIALGRDIKFIPKVGVASNAGYSPSDLT
ncbi:P27 family phage terminase small subunit [Bacillus cytotoxicus]|uniref:P27 family phage terminase small subunit n=1 Tax=Bacillus cytotoxicus TaxID=580165 RepID=UPI000863CF75|nr:P27 family phage terminase small subunit [Bacillus cytotoxicus]SCN42938.1 Gp1 [Bacillus cytotoxicus]